MLCFVITGTMESRHMLHPAQTSTSRRILCHTRGVPRCENGEDDDGSTPGGKRASGASEGGSNKKAKADITKDMSEAEYVKNGCFLCMLLCGIAMWC